MTALAFRASFLLMSDVVEHLTDHDNQLQMKTFIDQNGLKLDRLRKPKDYCAMSIDERDANGMIKKQSKCVATKMNVVLNFVSNKLTTILF